MFKFYIDGQLTDQPVNDTDLVTRIVRDQSTKNLLITQDVELIYNGNNAVPSGTISGYSYLKSLFEGGICGEAAISIYDQVSTTETYLVHTGVIKIPSIRIDLQKANLATKIQDNSFYAYVNNNKDIKVNFAANVTKDRSTAITPLDYYTVDLFNSNGCDYGSLFGYYYKGYSVYEAVEFIIKCISDNNLTFRSDYLSGLTEPLFIFKGQSLVTSFIAFPSAPDPTFEVSFAEIFNELTKIYNLVFYIDKTDPDNPVFVIEDYESTFGSEIVTTFDDVKNVTVSVDASNLFSNINVGSDVVIDGSLSAYTWNAATSYYGWKKEQFFPVGQCNIAVELDLVSQFIIDNNAIQDSLVLQNDAEIDSYFLIQCSNIDTYTRTADGHQFTYFGSPDCFYNLGINNFFKMQRSSALFETSFGNFLGVGSDGFRALIGDTAAQDLIFSNINTPGLVYVPPAGTTTPKLPYVNETTNGGYDGGNNYNNVTYEYTAPTGGNYSFLSRLFVQVAGMLGGTQNAERFRVFVDINVFDAGSVLQFAQTSVFDLLGAGSNGFHTLDTSMTAILNATDYVVVAFRITYSPNQAGSPLSPRYFAILNTSYFEANGTPDGGVSTGSGNPDIKKYIHEFDYAINATTWRLIEAGLISQLAYTKDNVTTKGWIKEMIHNNQTGATSIKLITSNALTST